MKMQKIMTVAVALVTAFITRTTFAASGTWNGISGNWSDTTNPGGVWTNGIPADGADATANFTGVNITINKTNTVDSARTIGNITFTDATTASHDLVINGSNTLTLDVTSGSPTINVTQSGRTLTISCPIGGDDGMTKSGAGTLNLSGNNSYSGGTTVNAGTINDIRSTSFGTGPITIAGNSTLTSGYGAHPVLANSIAVNNGVTATLSLATQYYTMTFDGVLSGEGTIQVTGGNAGATFRNATNTFAGTVIASGNGITINSLPDSANPIQLNNGTFTMNTGTASPMMFNSRKVELTGTTSGGIINNNNATATNTITINTDLRIVGTGNKTLTLGGSNTGSNTFAGAITNGTGSVISLTKAGAGTWCLAGTNTYSGKTFNNSTGGTLIFQDVEHSLPSGSALTTAINNNQTQVTKLLSDTSGTITLGNTVKADGGGSSGTGTMTIFVGNNGSANGGNGAGGTSNSTIVLGTLDLRSSTDGGLVDKRMATEVGFTGADGYSVQLGGLTLAARGDTSAKGAFLKPTTATLTITGTVQQNNGRTSGDNAGIQNLTLAGSGTGHAISGTIKNAADFDDNSNTNALPLNLVKSSTSTWTLSGTNTFSGTATVSGGTLVLAAGTCLSDTNLLTITTGGKVQLEAGVKEKVGLLKFGTTLQATGTWGSTSSSAQNTSTNFLGTGLLYVGIDIPASGTLIQIR